VIDKNSALCYHMCMEILVQSKSVARRGLIEVLAKLYQQKLNLNKSRFNIIIDTISDFAKLTGMNGATTLIDHETISIALDSRLNFEKLLTVLAHEMVHAKQYARGQLKCVIEEDKVTHYWCGVPYDTEYYESPWELEAFGRERILANSVAQILTQDK